MSRPGAHAGRAVAAWSVIGLVVLVAPYYLDEFWLQLGVTVAAAGVGAIGLTLLTGTAGQLSLAHGFFLGVGAVTYCVLAAPAGGDLAGLGLPTPVAALAGVVLAGLAGLAFSPIAARLRHIYLGIASIALVFLGEHVLNVAEPLTGGFNGRLTPDLVGDTVTVVADVPFGEYEKLWYVGGATLVLAAVYARNLVAGRVGRALVLVRDSEPAAAAVGIHVQSYKALAFVISSMYAGLAGVLNAVAIGSIAPQSFALDVSVLYLVMVVIGGLGSIGGAVFGAAVVTALPVLLQEYASDLPFLAQPGSGGITAGHAARYTFGIAVIAVVLVRATGTKRLHFRQTPPRSPHEQHQPPAGGRRSGDAQPGPERVQREGQPGELRLDR
ncbi:branched-chain amino acid ABC transporter permease [Dactylosporangium sp. NPDC049140]|uniref:branched-chain amino acid ABC transporter permease n=1 Tax=Dactylosporangium sp. NPDC049140 TaxID=3155647 RepID=UPI0033FF570B